jgi:hypothetical protein
LIGSFVPLFTSDFVVAGFKALLARSNALATSARGVKVLQMTRADMDRGD